MSSKGWQEQNSSEITLFAIKYSLDFPPTHPQQLSYKFFTPSLKKGHLYRPFLILPPQPESLAVGCFCMEIESRSILQHLREDLKIAI